MSKVPKHEIQIYLEAFQIYKIFYKIFFPFDLKFKIFFLVYLP